ncbi:MAG: ABC transporter ATP-binding protein [SAR324 cluster bacterium]|nr:ABC transporter ATP-binding protein [SAR324 cluster bacterium]MBF0351752.1 ABC transporter ATP-binding protein [SAR324 cluster bacterium]
MKSNLVVLLYRHVIAENKKAFWGVMLISVSVAIGEMVGVSALYPFFSMLSKPDLIQEQKTLQALYDWGNFVSTQQFVFFFGVGALGVFIAINILGYVKNVFIARFAFRQSAKISVKLLRNYLEHPYLYFLTHDIGEISKNIMVQSDAVAHGVLYSWIIIVSEFMVLFLITSIIIRENAVIGVILFGVFLLLLLVVYRLVKNILYKAGEETDAANGRRFSYCLEVFGSIKEIKVSQQESFFADQFSPIAMRHAQAFTKANIIQLFPPAFMQLLTISGLMTLTLFFIYEQTQFNTILSTLSLYAIAGYRMMPSFSKVANAISVIRQHGPIVKNVLNVLTQTPKVSLNREQINPISFNDVIKLNNLCLSYPGSNSNVFDNLNIIFKKNRLTALVGRSGAGKTSLVDVLTGLIPLQNGQILVDHAELSDDSRFNMWRRLIAYIPQSIFLMNRSIASNIAFGVHSEDIDWKKMKKVIEQAHLESFIQDLPDGWNTNVGERGNRLSGGQIQRIGIARALYRDPEVIIMDESTSALDGITEQQIIQTLQELKKQKTIIVIAHRNTTVRYSDYIVLMDKGNAVDAGTYEELVNRNPYFASLMVHSENKN